MNEISAIPMTVDTPGAVSDPIGRLRVIALSEMDRQRRRLGAMTPEQERALEELLISMVEKISHPVIEKAKKYYLSGEIEKARVWYSVFN